MARQETRYRGCLAMGWVVGLAMMVLPVQADIIVEYNFSPAVGGMGNPAPNFVNPDFSATNISVTGFTAVVGGTGSYASSPVLSVDNVTNSATVNENTALASGRYVSFTLDALNPSALMNLDNISFQAGRGGPSTPRAFYLYSSVDGFTAGNAIAVEMIPTVRPNFTAYDFPLGSQFEGLAGPVEFRIYGTVPSAGNQLDFDDLIVQGSLIPPLAPEPGSVVLFAAMFVIGGIAFWRRRRHSG